MWLTGDPGLFFSLLEQSFCRCIDDFGAKRRDGKIGIEHFSFFKRIVRENSEHQPRLFLS